MKKTVLVSLAFGLVAVAAAGAQAAGYTDYTPGAGIAGSPHDIPNGAIANTSYVGPNADPLQRICIYCHAPHHSLEPGSEYAITHQVDYLPLWNHAVTVQDYMMYDNGADEPTGGPHAAQSEVLMDGPGSVSRLCLSCHDGTVAVNEYGFSPSATTNGGGPTIAEQYKIGGVSSVSGMNSLINHHPIGFNYDAVQVADDEIKEAATSPLGNYMIADLLWAGKMECTTCHDVHNSNNTGEKLLYESNFKSQFCLACHAK
jgi:predicted CXXCH cytochrome family protein